MPTQIGVSRNQRPLHVETSNTHIDFYGTIDSSAQKLTGTNTLLISNQKSATIDYSQVASDSKLHTEFNNTAANVTLNDDLYNSQSEFKAANGAKRAR